MPKVYFRGADSKAISKDIDSQVNYDQAVDSISQSFRLPRQNIRLVYNGQTRTGNFNLNPEIPHHIVHFVDKSKIGHEEINITLTVNNGKGSRKVHNVKTNSNTPVKDFINTLFQSNTISKEKVQTESAELYHHGIKLSENETFLDRGVQNNANLNIMLKNNWPDPSDIPLCAGLLINTVDPLVMSLQMLPKYFSLSSQINALKQNNFFKHFQQRYEGHRPNVLFSDYEAYRFPTSIANQEEEIIDQNAEQQNNVPN